MAIKLGDLYSNLDLEYSGFLTGLKKSVDATARSSGLIEKAFKRIQSAAITLFAFETVRIIKDSIGNALDYAGSLGEVSQQLGVSSRDLQVFRYAAGQVGISEQEMDKALQRFTRTLGTARAGNQTAIGTFRELGLTFGEIKNGDPHEVLLKAADGIAQIKDRATRAAPEVAIFGKAGQQLDTLLSQGSRGINEFAVAAEKLGIVLSDRQIQQADDAADKLAAVGTVLQANIAGVVADNADAILALANALATVAINAGKAFEAINNWKNLRAYRGGSAAAFNAMSQSGSGRVTLLNELDAQLEQNSKDRAANRGARTSYLGGLVETTRDATDADRAKLDAQFRDLNRQRNLVLARERQGEGSKASGVAGNGYTDPSAAAAAARAAEQAAKERERLQQEALRREERGESELARMFDEYLGLKGQLSTDAREQAQLQHEAIEADAASRDVQIGRDIAENQITAAAGEELKLRGEINDQLKHATVNRELDAKLAEEDFDQKRAANDNQADLLRSAEALARTAKERQRLGLAILDLGYDMQRAELDAVIASKESTEAQKAVAQKRLEILGQLQGSAREGVIRGNQGPLGQLADSIPRTADEMNEALEGVAANGLSDVVDGFADVATGAKKMGDVVSDVLTQIAADILKLSLRKAILGPISQALRGLFGGASSIASPAIDFAGIEALIPKTGILAPARAGGGPVSAGKMYMVGEHGPEPFVPSANGTIIPNGGLKAMGGTVVNQTLNFSGAVDIATRTEVYRLAAATRQAAIDGVRDINRRAG